MNPAAFLRDALALLGRPEDLGYVRAEAWRAFSEVRTVATRVRALPAVPVRELAGEGDSRIALHLFRDKSAAVAPLEATALALLARRVRAKQVFEFGTYRGVSTTQLALNLEPGGHIHTLDLPGEPALEFGLEITAENERKIAREGGKGVLVPADLRDRVTFLAQDSAAFDPAPFLDRMDLVFVDGAHSADYVRNDSEKGWRMLRPGGVLVWHDCQPSHPDVARYVLRGLYPARRIVGTSLAFAEK